MAVKFGRKEFPPGLGPNSFECFGPIATEDGKFDGVMMADMGCFTQDGKDTNKAYHGAVVKGSNGKWYAYFQWGRTGGTGDFQFFECHSRDEAQDTFVKQMESKNSKRGMWTTIAGRPVLQAKPGKDCYLVRPLATRSPGSFGLPAASSVVSDEVKVTKTVKKGAAVKKTSFRKVDPQTAELMRILNVATVAYTKKSIQGGTIPTQTAIDFARDLLDEAMKRVSAVGDGEAAQLNDRDLRLITDQYYGRIPVVKPVGAPPSTWLLSSNNILRLRTDLDAYESALKTTVAIEEEQAGDSDPLGGMPVNLAWLDPKSEKGAFLLKWMPRATKNVHGHRPMRIVNMWDLERHGEPDKHSKAVQRILAKKPRITERPLFQPTELPGLTGARSKEYRAANVACLFHGTKSVNVSGIMREGLRLPNQLVGVAITGAMFGPGVYWADDWGKSANYCSGGRSMYAGGSGHVKGRESFMFVAEVALGLPHVAPSWGGHTRPPGGADCIFGKAGVSGVQNNEWIVFNTDQNCLKYLVEFSY